MTLVLDASVVAAALMDDGPAGRWSGELLAAADLAAPHLLPVEVTSVLRRATLAGDVSQDAAAIANGDLQDLAVTLYPFSPFAARVWDLRATISAYDAWYVAVAEAFDADLATLDQRLARASGPTCAFVLPPS